MGVVLLFYHYTDIENPTAVQAEQKAFCQQWGLMGRLIIGTEGINGTLGGSQDATDAYQAFMKNHPLFSSMPFKTSPGGAENFPKLSIKVKKEIVNLGLDPKEFSFKDAAPHLTPEEFHNAVEQADENTIIIDNRNAYEARVGTFKGSTIPPVRYFRQFPAYIDQNLENFKDKKILMFCTGGIRCERASAYMLKKGLKNVYQLHGGIHEYLNQFPDGHFRGMNYVFDSRMGTKTNDDVLGDCDLCHEPCETFTNCRNASCNAHFIGCPKCIETYSSCCSQKCKELLDQGLVKARPEPKKTYAHNAQ